MFNIMMLNMGIKLIKSFGQNLERHENFLIDPAIVNWRQHNGNVDFNENPKT